VAEASAALHCSQAFVYRKFKAGELKGYKLGGQKGIRIYRESVEQFKQDRENTKVEKKNIFPSPPPHSPARRKLKGLPVPKMSGYGHGL
jgi:excisionase family DNA binding protein